MLNRLSFPSIHDSVPFLFCLFGRFLLLLTPPIPRLPVELPHPLVELATEVPQPFVRVVGRSVVGLAAIVEGFEEEVAVGVHRQGE